jgi:hypothetical protein
MLVRSPTLRNSESSVTVTGSSPDSRSAGGTWTGTRGLLPLAEVATAAMWSGVVPQQPPSRLTSPLTANSSTTLAVWSGVSSYSPKALGRPALG